MNSFDAIDTVLYKIKKYILPLVFLAAGVWLLKLALVPEEVLLKDGTVLTVRQDKSFLYAALAFIFVSLVWMLYLLDAIKSFVGYAILISTLFGSFVILYANYAVIQTEVVFNNDYEERELEIKTRIMDIKAAQMAYKETQGTFTDEMDDLIDFVKRGKKMDIVKVGSLPERKITPKERDVIYGDNRAIDLMMNEAEATFLSRLPNPPADLVGFRRDTNQVPVMEALFMNKRYLTARSKIGGKMVFHPDSMRYVPFSRQETTLDTGSVTKGKLDVPTLLIKMKHPMKHPVEGFKVYTVGAVNDNHLRDNWSK